jgi:Tfp pilus assembly protein PilE
MRSSRDFRTFPETPYSEGFTLIEVLIYSGLLAVFLTIAAAAAHSTLTLAGLMNEREEILANQEFIERKLIWLASGANKVTVPPPNSSSSSELRLEGLNSSLNPAVFRLTDGALTLTTGSSTSAALTNSRVAVTNFKAEHWTNSASSSALKISLGLESVFQKKASSSFTFWVSVPQ